MNANQAESKESEFRKKTNAELQSIVDAYQPGFGHRLLAMQELDRRKKISEDKQNFWIRLSVWFAGGALIVSLMALFFQLYGG